VDGSRCSVLHCTLAPVHTVPLTPEGPDGPDVGVCGEHHAAMADGRWVHDRSRGGILLGADLDGLVQVDRTTMQVGRSFSPGVGTFSSLTIDGRSFGSGEPRSVEVVLTDDVVRQLAKLVWMFNRSR
jgi:hypothetical protein